jgi:hypothetical protein
MPKRGCAVLLLVAILSNAGSTDRFAAAAEWGSIKGRVIVANNPPESPMIVGPGGVKVQSEKFVLGKNNELANAVVYLRVAKGAPPVDVHPGFLAALRRPVTLDHKGGRFVPHIVVARKGQTLEMKNSDRFNVNTNIALLSFNQLIPPNAQVPAKVRVTAPLPTPMVCNIHPWMQGFLLALDHPYAVVTGDDGKFEIKNLPAGEREFQFWHESGYLKNGSMKTGETDRRGRIKLKVPAGETLDLGDVMVRL